MTVIGVQAQVLSPLYYHGHYIPDGSASDARVLTDTAMVFALAAIFGISPAFPLRAVPDYRADLQQIPWRASLFLAQSATILPPVRHTIDLTREGDYPSALQNSISKGNFKTTFFVQEIAEGSTYTGALWGPNPFDMAHQDALVVRMGVGRLGLVALRPIPLPDTVVLNVATAALFGQVLPETSRILASIRLSRPLTIADATRVWESTGYHPSVEPSISRDPVITADTRC